MAGDYIQYPVRNHHGKEKKKTTVFSLLNSHSSGFEECNLSEDVIVVFFNAGDLRNLFFLFIPEEWRKTR